MVVIIVIVVFLVVVVVFSSKEPECGRSLFFIVEFMVLNYHVLLLQTEE